MTTNISTMQQTSIDTTEPTAIDTKDLQQLLRLKAVEERRKRQKFIKEHRNLLLRELFLLTKDKENVISFLESNEEFTELDFLREKQFLDQLEFREGTFPSLQDAIQISTPPNDSCKTGSTEDTMIKSEQQHHLDMNPTIIQGNGDEMEQVYNDGADVLPVTADIADVSSPRRAPSPIVLIERHHSPAPTTANTGDSAVDTTAIVSENSTIATADDTAVPRPKTEPAFSYTATISDNNRHHGIGQQHTVQIYNGHTFVDKRNDLPSGFDLYAWRLKAQTQPLYTHLANATKVVSTEDWMLASDEIKSIKIITQIEQLKRKNMWSQRQLKRHKSVPRTKTHWDLLLDEMKWMRTDFKEERKWRMANAYIIAQAVMEWHKAPDKSTVCVKSRIPTSVGAVVDEPNIDSAMSEGESLVNSTLENRQDPLKNDVEMTEAATVDLPRMTEDDRKPSLVEDNEDDEEDDDEEKGNRLNIVEKENNDGKERRPPISLGSLKGVQTVFSVDTPDSNFIDVDPYFNEAESSRVVPFKLTAQRIQITSGIALNGASQQMKHNRKKRRTHQDHKDDDESTWDTAVEPLPLHERYDKKNHVAPLFSFDQTQDAVAAPVAPPAESSSTKKRRALALATSVTADGSMAAAHEALNTWSEEDDVCLIQLIAQYSFNWTLICDAFNTLRGSNHGAEVTGSTEKRTPWDCYERWKQKDLTSLSGQMNHEYLSKLEHDLTTMPNVLKTDNVRKRQRQHHLLEAIKQSQKKRKEPPDGRPNRASSPPKATIEDHGLSSNGQRLPTAMELSLMRTQREQQIARAAAFSQRQLYSQGLLTTPQHQHLNGNAIPPSRPQQQAQIQSQQQSVIINAPTPIGPPAATSTNNTNATTTHNAAASAAIAAAAAAAAANRSLSNGNMATGAAHRTVPSPSATTVANNVPGNISAQQQFYQSLIAQQQAAQLQQQQQQTHAAQQQHLQQLQLQQAQARALALQRQQQQQAQLGNSNIMTAAIASPAVANNMIPSANTSTPTIANTNTNMNVNIPTAAATTSAAATNNATAAATPVMTSNNVQAHQTRYPTTAQQIQLLRQQQLLIAAAAQQQGQPMRAMAASPMPQQQRFLASQNSPQALGLQLSTSPTTTTTTAATHNSHPNTGVDMNGGTPTNASISPQQQPPQPVNALALAAQLAQLGYPIQQSIGHLPAHQQVNLQRYLAQMQMRNNLAQQQQQQQQNAQATATAVNVAPQQQQLLLQQQQQLLLQQQQQHLLQQQRQRLQAYQLQQQQMLSAAVNSPVLMPQQQQQQQQPTQQPPVIVAQTSPSTSASSINNNNPI